MTELKQTVDFIKYLAQGSEVEINNLQNIIDFKKGVGKPNIYFCAGLKEKKQRRCEDDDIASKSYFFVDIDIRNERYIKYNEVIDQDKLYEIAGNIVAQLDLGGYGDFTGIVFSGNGLHLYYCGTSRKFDKQVYADGVEYVYNQIDQIIAGLGMCCDHACKNISRITRLPGSINPRKKMKKSEVLWDLGPIECDLALFEPKVSQHFEKLEEYAKLQATNKEQERTVHQTIKREIKQLNLKSDDIRKEINSIDIGPLAESVWGVTLGHDDGEIITLKERHKNMGAYIYKPYNVIYNQGSSLVKTQRQTFTPFEIICFEMFDGDRVRTLQYFKDKFGIVVQQKKEEIYIPEKVPYEIEGYYYPDEIFDDQFQCVMSGELVTIVAESNSGKTTFTMDMIQRNTQRGKKCFYINLEFGIEKVATDKRLYLNNKTKKNLTDIDPLSEQEKYELKIYVDKYLSRFKYYSNPDGLSLVDLVALIVEKRKEGYKFFVLDTFSCIHGNEDDNAYPNQNKCMKYLQTLCQKTGICLVLLHHTNKNGTMEGSKKILNRSNTLITMKPVTDQFDISYTKHTLTKDKFVSTKDIDTQWINRRRVLLEP